ncbi:type IX secretion system membrane protein PorP/SprF [Flavobacterium azooxidireducens]|uniref:Type IX secretion system membrane protein PorP/SprF n=1 Tax=Flavobacterium azooxidireducens TaxID=1871076 RepID=A0ABY4KHR0_9FLAO|nr:type IX secretion system membrane protein PorP/SprF [Flavobacterium azooxidireducens]UPQ79811.1 type IX secretion system membrane protein PorP/SprF [Flavobacterium azooxidireducens]
MKKIVLTLAFALMIALDGQAQQDPHYTQYMYNMNIMNPAYAGSKESLSVGLLYRAQWVEIEGAPKTGTLSIHSPVGKNVGLGLSAITDKIGPVEENNVYADFSYTLNLGGEHRLAFGIKGGATFHKVGLFSDIGNGFVPDPDDPAFSENSSNTYLNLGSGLFYYNQKFYAAFSVPNMLKSKHLDVTQNGQEYEFGSEVQHYFLTAGYVFDLSENTKFKPSFMMKSSFNAPTSLDVSANVLFFNKFELGATYRLEDSFGGMINFAITPSIRVGYAYDHIVSDLNVTTPASHEFMLLFDLNFSKKISISPRFF